MHRRHTLNVAVTALALVATLAACGDEQPETTPAAATPATTTPAAPTSAPATSSAPAALTVGKSATFLDGQVTTTVMTYKQPAGRSGIPKPDQPGYEWASIQIKVCTTTLITVSTALWKLTYADGAVIEPSGVRYEQLPQPRYPWADHQVQPDRCVRGWITYEVPKGERPAFVQYEPDGQVATEWRVK